MTSEQTAAWVAAGAAVIQAIGSILAIVYAVRIAHSAEVRAVKAERAALDREEAARKASLAREEAAEAASIERVRRAELGSHNSIIATANSLLENVASELHDEIKRVQGDPARERQTFIGNFTSVYATQLRNILPELQSRATDPKLVTALVTVDTDLGKLLASSKYNGPGSEVIRVLTYAEERLAAIRRALDGERRT